MATVTSKPVVYAYDTIVTTTTSTTPNLNISSNDCSGWFDLDSIITNKIIDKCKKCEEPEESKEPDEPVIDSDFVTPERIIYNPPCTIVFWKNCDKTVVRCSEGETFNKYYGYCAALAKHISGNNNRLTKLVNSGIDSTKTAKKLEKDIKKTPVPETKKSEVKKPTVKKPISKKSKKGSK